MEDTSNKGDEFISYPTNRVVGTIDDPADYAAAKIAIFIASLLAGLLGAAILWPREAEGKLSQSDRAEPGFAELTAAS